MAHDDRTGIRCASHSCNRATPPPTNKVELNQWAMPHPSIHHIHASAVSLARAQTHTHSLTHTCTQFSCEALSEEMRHARTSPQSQGRPLRHLHGIGNNNNKNHRHCGSHIHPTIHHQLYLRVVCAKVCVRMPPCLS